MTIYARPDGLYVASSDQTTDGLWIESVRVEFVVPDSSSAIGGVVGRLLDGSRVGVRHPRQDEWTAKRAVASKPLLALARVRSWTAFLQRTAVVGVHRNRDTDVTPYRQSDRPRNSFEQIVGSCTRLTAPSDDELGVAVIAAVAVARASGAA